MNNFSNEWALLRNYNSTRPFFGQKIHIYCLRVVLGAAFIPYEVLENDVAMKISVYWYSDGLELCVDKHRWLFQLRNVTSGVIVFRKDLGVSESRQISWRDVRTQIHASIHGLFRRYGQDCQW